ncbi:MAG: hypothetical protein OXU19_03050 [bacterium]|nr:hypothetical protein [bacterium]MDE0243028.1 hypothetical protein [bacterium]MDE0416081.1 hypothetical protein [bacterium]
MKEPGVLRYGTRSIAADYARAAFGAVACLAPPLLVDVTAVLAWILVAVGALFVAFGLRTLLRHLTVYELSPEGIRAAGPLGASVSWKNMTAVNLAYFQTRPRRKVIVKSPGGWMELTLREDRQTIKIDSSLQGFDDVVGEAARVARERGLTLNPVTLANLEAMGFVHAPVEGEEILS